MFRIREILKERKMLVKDLANLVGVASNNMSNIINGKFTPSLSLLERIAEALDAEIWELFQGSPGKDKNIGMNKPNINGYVEIGSEIKKVTCLDDLEKIKKEVESIVSSKG